MLIDTDGEMVTPVSDTDRRADSKRSDGQAVGRGNEPPPLTPLRKLSFSRQDSDLPSEQTHHS